MGVPSVQNELKDLRDIVEALQKAREGEKLDERFGALQKIIKLQEESTAGQIKLLSTDIRTVADQLRESNSLLMEVSTQVRENRSMTDANSTLIGQGFMIQNMRDGKPVGKPIRKLLGETFLLHVDKLEIE